METCHLFLYTCTYPVAALDAIQTKPSLIQIEGLCQICHDASIEEHCPHQDHILPHPFLLYYHHLAQIYQ